MTRICCGQEMRYEPASVDRHPDGRVIRRWPECWYCKVCEMVIEGRCYVPDSTDD